MPAMYWIECPSKKNQNSFESTSSCLADINVRGRGFVRAPFSVKLNRDSFPYPPSAESYRVDGRGGRVLTVFAEIPLP